MLIFATMIEQNSRNFLIDLWNKGGFILCTGGRAELSINGKQYFLAQGEVLFITPLVLIKDTVFSEDFTFLSFVNELKVYYDIFNIISNTPIPLSVYRMPIWPISPSEEKYVIRQHRRLIHLLDVLAHTDDNLKCTLLEFQIKLLCQEVTLEVIECHIRYFSKIQKKTSTQDLLVYSFILNLHSSYRTHRSVAHYARLANLSTGHFSKIVKRVTGQCPSVWITTITITYTKFMLEDNKLNIKQIAAELNFPEQFTFRKYFKQYTGLSPKAYREKIRK